MATSKSIDWNKWLLPVLAIALIGWVVVGHIGCEATVPLRPEVAEAAGLPPLTADKKPVEVPLSGYPAVEALYEKKQAAKADEKKAEAANVAAAAEVKIVKATRNVAREIRTLQERLEDDTEAVRAQAGLAAKDAEAAIAKINAETQSTKAMQAVAVEAARQRQAVIDQFTQLGLGAAQTAAASQAGTPWGPLAIGAVGILGTLFGVKKNGEAKAKEAEVAKVNSALDTSTAAIEELDAMNVPLAQPMSVPDGKGGTRTITTAGQLAKWKASQIADVGDNTTIQQSLARQNYAANV